MINPEYCNILLPHNSQYLAGFSPLMVIALGAFLFPAFQKINKSVKFTVGFLIPAILLIVLLQNNLLIRPDYFTDTAITKNLPPLSSGTYITLKGEPGQNYRREYYKSLTISGSTVALDKGASEEIFILNDVLKTENKPEINTQYFLFGTDKFGRDIFSRIIYGAKESFIIGISATLISTLLAVLLGILAASSVKIADTLLVKLSQIFLSIPAIFLILFLSSLIERSLFSIILILASTSWMLLFTIIRSEIKLLHTYDFYITSGKIGLGKLNLLIREIIPFIFPLIGVNIIFQFANILLAESALSFLGLSYSADSLTWGSLISEGLSSVTTTWWVSLFPSLFLTVTLLFMFRLSDSLKRENKVL